MLLNLLVKVISQPQPIIEDALTTMNNSSTPHEITPLTASAPIGVSKERIQEFLCNDLPRRYDIITLNRINFNFK